MRAFRTELGRFVTSGDGDHLKRAFSAYAGRATGGGAKAAQRMSASTATGSALWGGLQELAAGGTGQSSAGADLTPCLGKPTDEAIEILAGLLLPSNPDADRVRASLTSALAEALEGQTTFEVTLITPDFLSSAMLLFMTHTIFEQMVLDSDNAFRKSQSLTDLARRENDLYNAIKAAVDRNMAEKLHPAGGVISVRMMSEIQSDTIHEVWAEWERE
jgi:hypothetical protein